MNLRTLSVSEAVAATGISRDTLYVLLESGQVTGNRPSPKGRWRISEQSLAAWVSSSRTTVAAAPAKSDSRDDYQKFRERFPESPEERVFG